LTWPSNKLKKFVLEPFRVEGMPSPTILSGFFYLKTMAEGKKSFVLYADLLQTIEHLTSEEKGILFNHLLEYVNDKNPVMEDRLILTAWKPIEMQLKRDLKKFENVKEKRSEAGKASAKSRAANTVQQNSTKSTSVKSVKQCSTNPTDNVNDNDNVNDINKKNQKFIFFFPEPKDLPQELKKGIEYIKLHQDISTYTHNNEIERNQKGWITFAKSWIENSKDKYKEQPTVPYHRKYIPE
jgi:hypothetical protein